MRVSSVFGVVTAIVLPVSAAFADTSLLSDTNTVVGWSFYVDWVNDVGFEDELEFESVGGNSQVVVEGWDATSSSWADVASFGLSMPMAGPSLATHPGARARSSSLAPSLPVVSSHTLRLADLDVYTSFQYFHVHVSDGSPIRLTRRACDSCSAEGESFRANGGVMYLLSPAPPVTVSTSHNGLNGTTGAMAYDFKLNTWFQSSSNNWQWIRIDFGEVVEVTKFRRYMSRNGTSITGTRGAQGEQIYTQGRTTDPRTVVPAAQTTGWSAYNNYTPNAWHSVPYGWSAWLNLNTPKRARYFEFNWDGNSDVLNDVEVTYSRYDSTAPAITSTPPHLARVGLTTAYQLAVADPDPSETFVFSLVEGPAGATLSAGGLLQWTPVVGQRGGPHRIVLRVTDSWERSTDQVFYVGVRYIDSQIAAQLTITSTVNVLIRGNTTTFPQPSMVPIPLEWRWTSELESIAYSRLAGTLAGVPGITDVRLSTFDNSVSAVIGTAGLAALQENHWAGSVELVHSLIIRPTLDESTVLVGATPLEAYTHLGTGAGATVAIIDSGVESNHDFFVAGGDLPYSVIRSACFSTAGPGVIDSGCNPLNAPIGWPSGEPCSFDDCDHGTHVAGIAAGFSDSDASLHGIAPDANIIAIQAMYLAADCGGGERCGSFFTDTLKGALEYVVDRADPDNVASVNMSLGTTEAVTDCPSDLSKQLRALRRKGVAAIASSGNDATAPGYVGGLGYPQCQAGFITVGSTDDDEYDDIIDTSKFSPELDFLAPGWSIESSVPGNSYAHMWGTSMAAPHVAGAYALIRSHFGKLDVDTVTQELKSKGRGVFDPRIGMTFPSLNLRSIGPMAPVPHAPLDLRVNGSPRGTQVTLVWQDDSAIETHYELQARYINGVPTANASGPVAPNTDPYVSETEGNISGLSPSTSYNAYVRACNSGQCSAWVGPVPFTTASLNVPTETLDYFRVSSLATNAFSVEWRKSTLAGDRFFRLLRFGPFSSVVSEDIAGTTSAVTKTFSNLRSDEVYSLYLRICNSNGCGSAVGLSVLTAGGLEPPPVITSPVPWVSDRAWDISWTYAPDPAYPAVTNIVLEYTSPTAGGMMWSQVFLPPATRTYRLVLTEAVPSISFRVKSCRSAGCTAYSRVVRP